jgi:hypothetical protein
VIVFQRRDRNYFSFSLFKRFMKKGFNTGRGKEWSLARHNH